MLAISRQARWVRALMGLTVAWQAFVYGWALSAVGPGGGIRGPGFSLAWAWTESARPPVGALLEEFLYGRVEAFSDPVRAADRLQALMASAAHALWISMALVLAGTYASEGVAGLWGYMLAAWNPMAVYAVVERRWDVLVGQCLVGLALYVWLRRWWMAGVYLFWTALAIDLHVLFWWPALAWRVLRLRSMVGRALALLPGILLVGWIVSYAGGAGWMRGWATWWWGSTPESVPGWNVFMPLVLTSGAGRTVGWFSLGAWLLFTAVLLGAYAAETMRFRTLMTWCAVGAWLLFWRSHFVEMGLALYWLALYVAHRARWYREPLCTSPETQEPE